jgi:hypothetical protein
MGFNNGGVTAAVERLKKQWRIDRWQHWKK